MPLVSGIVSGNELWTIILVRWLDLTQQYMTWKEQCHLTAVSALLAHFIGGLRYCDQCNS